MIIALLAMAFTTSCSKDDDEPEPNVSIEKIAGEYLGTQNTTVTVMGAQVPVKATDVKASVVANEDGTLTVSLLDFTYNNDNYGNIVVSPVAIDKATTSEAEFSGKGTCTLTKAGKDYTAEIVALKGKYVLSGEDLNVDMDMNLPVSPRMTIAFKINYQGKK